MARFLVADGLRAVVPDRPGYFGPAQVGEPGPGSSSRGARGHDVVIDEDQVVDAEALELLGGGGSGAAGADDSDGEGSQ